ncbi:group III truncated hemoglobin [Antrihabitans stalactiti]|uniref:Group III truncated hemoglobin n=1 Tax=Antrihabitans stalactiti TaxID=2584121 RepID=A0A848KMC6_9NOCA|nr:group III truncated hemoglobin [Antrihabitans stalactiti]NMN99088.1 group III truncated hemoglobin [Antrihabitans stalactiti]
MDALHTGCTCRSDIADRNDVEALLRAFYERALTDELLREPFTPIRATGLDAHLPVMCDFWETVLFGSRRYDGSVFRVHTRLHERHVLTAAHFLRWLSLWTDTVDELHTGPIAQRAKLQATRMAWAMNRRLTGVDPTWTRPAMRSDDS